MAVEKNISLGRMKTRSCYFFCVLLLAFIVTGCGSVRPSFLPNKQNLTPHSLTPVEITQAFRSGNQLYIQYLEKGRLHHQVSSFDRIVHVEGKPVNQSFSKITRHAWKSARKKSLSVSKDSSQEQLLSFSKSSNNKFLDQQKIALLSEDHWLGFSNYLEKNVNQKNSIQQASISAGYFNGKSKSIQEPSWDVYRFWESTVSGDLILPNSASQNRSVQQQFFQQLKNYLAFHYIDSQTVLFQMAGQRNHAIEFVLIDAGQETIETFSLALHTDFIKPSVMKRSFLTDSGVTFGQLMKSMAMDLVIRPVSSFQRLTFLMTDTAYDNIQRTALTTIKFPSLSSQPIPEVINAMEYDPALSMDIAEWEAQLDKMTTRKPKLGRMNFLIDGDEFFPRFIESINDAEEGVYLHFYIFDSDDFAVKVADLLREKSRDLDVKVLYDGSGSLVASWGSSASQPVDYRAPVTIGQYLSHDSNVQYRVLGTPWLASDHTKTVVVDSDLAFVGGMNIGREYRYEWHDIMTEVQGPIVNHIRREFDKTWAHQSWFGDLGYLAALFKPTALYDHANKDKSQNKLKEGQLYPIRMLKTTPIHSEIYHTQIAAIRNAKQRIFIQNSYLTDDVIIYELAKARRRGVDVRVIMSLETDAGAISRSNLLSANTLLENGVRVYAFPRMTHVKAAIYDGWACLGSANFDHLSLRVNKELNLATSNPEAVDALYRELFLKDFATSVEITEKLDSRWTDQFVEIVADHM